jgi:uncharacterized Tic20 family protein
VLLFVLGGGMFAPLVPAGVMVMASNDKSPYMARHARQALVYQVAGLVLVFCMTLMPLFLVIPFLVGASLLSQRGAAPNWSTGADSAFGSGTSTAMMGQGLLLLWYGCLVLLSLAWVGIGLYAASRALNGQDYSYPVLGKL